MKNRREKTRKLKDQSRRSKTQLKKKRINGKEEIIKVNFTRLGREGGRGKKPQVERAQQMQSTMNEKKNNHIKVI